VKRLACKKLRNAVHYVVVTCDQSPAGFLQTLQSNDLQMITRTEDKPTGTEITGVSFYRDGECFTGSQLHPDFTWPALAKRFNYGPEHLALIQRHTADVKAQAQMVCTLRRADEGVSPL